MKRHWKFTHFLILTSLYSSLISASQPSGTTTTPSNDDKHSDRDLKIAAFNVQVFGAAKMRKPDVVNILVQIIRRYDVILIQEIREASGEAIITLLEQVNSADGHDFEMVISDRLGRTRSKEQYAFLYRTGVGLEVTSTYQYPDRDDDFERPPFAILLKVPNQELEEMALVAIHADPDEAEDEIDALVDVHKAVKKKWKTDNIVLMGDLNAAPPYTTKTEMKKLKLRDSKYLWLIPDSLDTTIGKSDSAYDRFIVTGKALKNSIVPGSATTFRFNEHFRLDNDESKAVSDHFPIEFALSTSGKSSAMNGGMSLTGFLFKVKQIARGFLAMRHYEL